jgi:hypothetical protein
LVCEARAYTQHLLGRGREQIPARALTARRDPRRIHTQPGAILEQTPYDSGTVIEPGRERILRGQPGIV